MKISDQLNSNVEDAELQIVKIPIYEYLSHLVLRKN